MTVISVSFEQNFLVLPPKHQEIWKVLHYFCNTYHNAFPSHAKLAELAHCSIRTVRTALKNFKNFGWLESTRRCYRSCLYYIHEKLLKLNPKDKKNFLKPKQSCESYEQGGGGVFRGKLQHELQHIYGIPNSRNSIRSNVHHTGCKKDGKTIYIRPNLQNLPFTAEKKVQIQRTFTEAEIALAAESYNSYKKPKKEPIALFWWLCKSAKQMFKGK